MSHSSKNAFVIGCFSTKDVKHFAFAMCAARSIRQAGNNEDIVIFTNAMADNHKRLFEAEGYIVIHRPIFHYKHMWCIANRRGVCFWDGQRFNIWGLTQYDKIFSLDADILCVGKCDKVFDLPELTYTSGTISPINAGRLVLVPSQQVHDDLVEILQGPFNNETGWNNIGKFDHWSNVGEISDWTFNSARGSQGYLYYYFKYIRKSLYLSKHGDGFNHIIHFTGDSKNHLTEDNKYTSSLKDLGLYELCLQCCDK